MNANEADQMVDCLHARAGFTWDHSQKQCIEAPKAGCSKTTNKFLYYDKCHESMLPRKRTEFIKKIVIFSFLLFLQIVLQKLSECDTNVLPKENIVYDDDDDDTVVTPVQSTNSLQKKEVCV